MASNCPSLHEIPKIFLVDACRGNRQERVFHPKSTGSMATKSSDISLSRHASTESGTDSGHFVIVYASTHGNVAYTSHRGSQLTQTFVSYNRSKC